MATDSSIASAFSEAAKGGSSFPADQLASAARSAGASPSLAEVKAFAAKCSSGVTASAFADFCKQTSHKDSPQDLLAFFQSMDLMDTGKVKKEDVKKCLMSFGEGLSDAEADGVLNDIFPGQEEINYQLLVQKLLSQARDLKPDGLPSDKQPQLPGSSARGQCVASSCWRLLSASSLT
ncbi:hypothetical protein Efla_005834 [Eimeria flavescens]